jgi:hypothetical protein
MEAGGPSREGFTLCYRNVSKAWKRSVSLQFGPETHENSDSRHHPRPRYDLWVAAGRKGQKKGVKSAPRGKSKKVPTSSPARRKTAPKNTAPIKAKPKKAAPTKTKLKKATLTKAATRRPAPKKAPGKNSKAKNAPARNAAAKVAGEKTPRQHKVAPLHKTAHRAPTGERKRLKKSVAAQAVARADALLQAEKDREREKIERAKEKARLEQEKAKARVQKTTALKKAREQEAKARAREQAESQRKEARALAQRVKEEARQAKEDERRRRSEEKAAATAALQAERLRRAEQQSAALEAKEKLRTVAALERQKAKEAAEAAREQKKKERQEAREEQLRAREQAQAKKLKEKEEARAEREQRGRTLRELKLQEREEARRARELAQQEALEAKSQRKAEEKAARELARIEAAQRKQDEAEAKKREQALLRQTDEALKECRKLQEKKLSAPLTELTASLVQALGGREGLMVVRNHQGPRLTRAQLAEYAPKLPSDLLDWYSEVGPFDFLWETTERAEGQAPSTGHLYLPPVEELPPIQEGCVVLAEAPQSELREWPSFEAYLLRGLETLFTWQSEGAVMDSLHETAAPRFTPTAELEARLMARGLSEKGCRALLQLFGPRGYLLVHESEMREGQRRRDLLRLVAEQEELSLSVLDGLSEGPSVGKREWKAALEAHERFLEEGGAGGSWLVTITCGLPLATYRRKGAGTSLGQASFARENLADLSARGARLPWANFCGARAPEMNFAGANLKGSCFSYGLLSHANFQGADLSGCDFSGARLVGADFRKAILIDTNFEQADLTRANFGGTLTKGTKFGGANVRGIRY